MATKAYRRDDVHLVVELSEQPAPRLTLRLGQGILVQPLSTHVFDGLAQRHDERMLSGLLREVASALETEPAPDAVDITRLVLHIPAALAWAPWEAILTPLVGRRVVRAVTCRPAVYDRPLVSPLRALEVTTGDVSLERWFSDVLGYAMERFKGTVPVLTATGFPDDADRMLERVAWPGADLLHIASGVLRPSDPGDDAPRSPGWLERLVRLARARLVVLAVDNREEARFLREVGDLLARRGGPAVVVPLFAGDDLGTFYARILHDAPIDVAARELQNPAVIVGEGREEAARLSAAAERLVGLGGDLKLGPRSREAYADLALQWEELKFEHSEGEGLFPTERVLRRMRSAYVDEEPSPAAVVETAQHVNASLHDGSGALDQRAGAPLAPGSSLHLRIFVGPVEEQTRAASARPLLIEPELFAADRGLWCEVGVTGIGWEVADDPLQQLFVPFSEPSDACWFTVTAIEEGAPALRYTLFHNGHVLQSFKLAAIVGETGADPDEALAAALDLPATAIDGRRWYSRLEFSTVATFSQAREREPRTLSIIANKHAGQHVLTFKTAGRIDVRLPGDIDDYVTEARRTLTELTFSGKDATNYRFDLTDNAGSFEWFTGEVMLKLATTGAKLYEALIPLAMRSKLPSLGGKPGTIQVANILRDRVIPWAALYQGKYDENERLAPDGTPAGHGVCTALVSDDENSFTWACGERPSCLLHADQVAARAVRGEPPLLAETVACPGRLWGLRHRIDVPPQQATEGRKPPASVDTIKLDARATAVLAYSQELRRGEEHVKAVRDLLDGRNDVVTRTPTRRAQILRDLDDAELGIVYLFCKTNAGPENPLPPTLFFSDGTDLIPLASADLGERVWSRRPLVVLNGCGTAGFSARAVSQFITAFVDDRTAAGVLGTEVAVPDVLAAEVGLLFLERFAKGRSAGEALLAARQALMRRFNPLGLSYTLYGTSELHLEPKGAAPT